eukprot:7164407-Alexandrium_andersonii.AAC.1
MCRIGSCKFREADWLAIAAAVRGTGLPHGQVQKLRGEAMLAPEEPAAADKALLGAMVGALEPREHKPAS